MDRENGRGFRFGLEAEFMLVDAGSFAPLWHHDLCFCELNDALEAIPFGDLPSLDGLELEAPHRKLMPFVVEGYHVPDPDLKPTDILPKGVEIRTPACSSIDECLGCLTTLHERLQSALERMGFRAVTMSHHPLAHHFEGPQNKRRHDFWQWAMQAMLTYGPDINVSLPTPLAARIDARELHAKVNYYAPALTALTLASPLYRGGLWMIRGKIGKSIRTYRRSVVAPAIELHPHEAGRMEYKTFESTHRIDDFHAYFLLWLELLLDDALLGRASEQSRIYDLGAVARFGLEAESVRERAAEVLDRAPRTLATHGFDGSPLVPFTERLASGQLPADEMIEWYEQERSIPAVLRRLAHLEPAKRARPQRLAEIMAP